MTRHGRLRWRANCTQCMSFVAQIDAVEHDSKHNPLHRDALGSQDYMFGDVGMVYVFFCFESSTTQSVFQQYGSRDGRWTEQRRFAPRSPNGSAEPGLMQDGRGFRFAGTVAAYATGCALTSISWLLGIRALSSHDVWSAVTAWNLAALTGPVVGMSVLWFALAFVCSGGFARDAVPYRLLAFVLGVVVACALGMSFVVECPRVLGAFVGPLLAGLVIGRASLPRKRVARIGVATDAE